MNSQSAFEHWFSRITAHASAHLWQQNLAELERCKDRVIRIPTGMGKTEGILAAWSFHRIDRGQAGWPLRLVWCLPMRVLVEQTLEVAWALVDKMPAAVRPRVQALMGGMDAGDWYLYPEEPAILVGTQDMLLSRALNRGYAVGRARWPSEFGLLNHDSLWVMDEVQLMDVGLATSAQLQAFRQSQAGKNIRPCHTWWMSATLQTDWLKTVDTQEFHPAWIQDACTVRPEQRQGGIWEVTKSVTTDSIPADQTSALATRILLEHQKLAAGDYGRITLVICNTVDRACSTFDALEKIAGDVELRLVHSRFRPQERIAWRDQFLTRAACTPEANRIIVATQVVEAGVDISAGCLISELAPWPNLVQRFGRCARYGGNGHVLVIDQGREEKSALPYGVEELEGVWDFLKEFQDVSIGSLESGEQSLDAEQRRRLYPYAPNHLLLQKEFDELFDTTPDLTGADLDISRFIRSGDERDLQVFWLSLGKDQSPADDRLPRREELCAVPFLKARDWLCGKTEKLKGTMRAWVWDWLDGEWKEARSSQLLPGRVVCVAADCGGYDPVRGFAPESKSLVEPVPETPSQEQPVGAADASQDGEQLSFSEWKTIACHSREVAAEADQIADRLGLPEDLRNVLKLAGRWHDWGKSHPAFQGAIRADDRPAREDLAKGPERAWLRPPGTYRYADDSDTRRGFRHELASVLGLFAVLERYRPNHPALLGPWQEVFSELGYDGIPAQPVETPPESVREILDCSARDFNLLAYLIASHHGKVRVGFHAAPCDQDYQSKDQRGFPIRGVREQDALPAIACDPQGGMLPEVSLTLSPAALGLSPRTGISWRERCQGLLEEFGPAALAWLETLLRAADVRASRLTTNDPALDLEATP